MALFVSTARFSSQSLPQSPPLFSANRFPHSPPAYLLNHNQSTRRTTLNRKFGIRAVDQSQTDVIISKTEDKSDDSLDVCSAADVVRRFYGGVNCRDLSSVVDLIAVDCVYEDLVFAKPFVGRKVVNYSFI